MNNDGASDIESRLALLEESNPAPFVQVLKRNVATLLLS